MVYPIQTNLFALMILIIIYGAMRQNKPIALRNERYFFAMVYSVMAILVVDTASEILNGVPGPFFYVLHASSIFFLYAISGIGVLFWVLYTIDYIGLKSKSIKILYTLPATLFVLMAFSSLFFDWFFSIGPDNVYTRGPMFSFYTIFFIGYVAAVLLFILVHLKQLKQKDWLPLLALPILPAVGGVIQFLHYGVLLFWPMTALSLLIVFIFIQLRLIRVDNLTQLYTKHEFNRKIQTFKMAPHHQKLGCMVCDIDHFKKINDTYGHFTGDLVLKELSHIFEETFNHYNHFVARIGGDEFGFLFTVSDDSEFNQKIAQLEKNITDLNKKNVFDFELSVSIGAGLYDKNTSLGLDSFFRDLDVQMYKNKKIKASDESKT